MYSDSPKLQRTRFAVPVKESELESKDPTYKEEFMNQLKLVDVSI